MFAAAICVSILLGVLVWALPGRLCDRRATHADVLAGPGIVLAVWIIAACVFAQPGLAQGFDLFRLLAINGAALWACGTVLLLRLRSGRRYRTLWTVAALLIAAIGLEVFVGNAPYFATHGYQPVDLRAYLQDAPADGEPIASAVGASVCECVLLLLAGSYAFYKWTSVLVVVPLAARLAIGRQAGRKIPFLRLFALCMFVTVLTGGIVTALDSFFSSDATVMICCGFVISYIVLKCFCERSNESRRLYRVTLLKDGKRACATALYDTGNLLKKQPQQIPVHIGGSALFDIVGEDAGFFDVPYKSLGNDGGSIKVCEFDEMTVMKGNGKLILHNVLVGRASDSLFENNAYDMILNEAVFSNKTGMENTLGK